MHNLMREAFFEVNAQRIALCLRSVVMQTPGSRLRAARERAGYKTVTAGAERVATNYSTYAGHENGNRGFSRDEAVVYGKAFHVRPEWLMFGDLGVEPIATTDDPQPPLAPIVKAIEDYLDGLTEAEQRTIAGLVKRQRALLRPDET